MLLSELPTVLIPTMNDRRPTWRAGRWGGGFQSNQAVQCQTDKTGRLAEANCRAGARKWGAGVETLRWVKLLGCFLLEAQRGEQTGLPACLPAIVSPVVKAASGPTPLPPHLPASSGESGASPRVHVVGDAEHPEESEAEQQPRPAPHSPARPVLQQRHEPPPGQQETGSRRCLRLRRAGSGGRGREPTSRPIASRSAPRRAGLGASPWLQHAKPPGVPPIPVLSPRRGRALQCVVCVRSGQRGSLTLPSVGSNAELSLARGSSGHGLLSLSGCVRD